MQKFQRKKREKPTEIIQLKSKDIADLREEILDLQKGVCAISGKIPKRPCLDHGHSKRLKLDGRVRGVLDSTMNVFLAKIENNASRCGLIHSELPEILRNIAKYLEKEPHPFLHPSEAEKPKKLTKNSYKKLLKVAISERNFPKYPVSKKLTVKLEELFNKYGITPEFYK